MAPTHLEIKFQSLGHYRGIEILSTMLKGKLVFVAWMDKFYSSDQVNVLHQLIDAWWKVRAN